MNIAFEFLLRNFHKIFRPEIFPEQIGCDNIYPLVSALSRKDRSDQKLEGICVI